MFFTVGRSVHKPSLNPPLNNACLGQTERLLPIALALCNVLQLQSQGGDVLLAPQEEDAPPLIEARGLTDPRACLLIAHA